MDFSNEALVMSREPSAVDDVLPDGDSIYQFEDGVRAGFDDAINAGLDSLRGRWNLSEYVGGAADVEPEVSAGLHGLVPEDAKTFWNAYDSVREGFAGLAEMATRARKDFELAVIGETIRQQTMSKIDFLAKGVFAGKPATVGLLRAQADMYYSMWENDFANYLRENPTGEGAKGLALITPDGKVNSSAMTGLMQFSASLNSIVNKKPDEFAVKYDHLLDMVRSAVKLETVRSLERAGWTPRFMNADFPDALARDWDEFIWMMPGEMSGKPFTSRFGAMMAEAALA